MGNVVLKKAIGTDEGINDQKAHAVCMLQATSLGPSCSSGEAEGWLATAAMADNIETETNAGLFRLNTTEHPRLHFILRAQLS
jgi:hypothetical protein